MANFTRIFDGSGNQFWFSYETLVAFKTNRGELYCRVNEWSTTTGRHLNEIQPDKKLRLDYDKFKVKYEELFPFQILPRLERL